MSKVLKSVVSRPATSAAPASATSTMLALGATRWAAFGLRVAVVGLVSAGATALDAYNGEPQGAVPVPAPIVTEDAPRQVAPSVAPREGVIRDEAPVIEQVNAPPVAERTASRAGSSLPRAAENRKDEPAANDAANRQGDNEVRKLIRRGYGLTPADANNTPR